MDSSRRTEPRTAFSDSRELGRIWVRISAIRGSRLDAPGVNAPGVRFTEVVPQVVSGHRVEKLPPPPEYGLEPFPPALPSCREFPFPGRLSWKDLGGLPTSIQCCR